MSWKLFFRPRTIVLLLLWSLPILFYVGAGFLALYQTGWFYYIVWTLPPLWLLAWIVGRVWKPPKLHQSADRQPLAAPTFWTPRDADAIKIVEAFRGEVDDVDAQVITDFNRYLADAQELAGRLANHYHAGNGEALLHPLTLVEILAVIHLAVEDLEQWVLANVPASDLATIGQLQRVPGYLSKLDMAQKAIFVASAVFNPAKLFAYPIWRKSGRVAFELQNELIRTYYQRYLRQLGYYMIEMYSGRLQGGSQRYRAKFGPMAAAIHVNDGNSELLDRVQDVETTIAVIGQVKAGKSSLINSLIGDQVAKTSVLPETKDVSRHVYAIDGSENSVVLLDTPGYSEADVSKQQKKDLETASTAADMILLVLAANVTARDADLRVVRQLMQHYESKPQLRPPTIIGIVTHIDRLRPIREWSPPYDWRNPQTAKEESMAETINYLASLFGDLVADYACVYTGEEHDDDSSVADQLVPLLVDHLDHGRSAAVLKAFYSQLNKQRIQRLIGQVTELAKTFQ